MEDRELENELSMFKKLSQQADKTCPSGLIDLHTDFLISIKRDIHKSHNDLDEKICKVDEKVDKLGIVEIINGNKDGTATMYERNVYFQTIYNRVAELRAEAENRKNMKGSLLNFNWWVHNLIPLGIVLAVVIMLVFLMLGQYRQANELQSIIKSVK